MKPPTEKAFLAQVRQLAQLHNWLSYHAHDSRRSEPGFPDLVLVRRKVDVHGMPLKGRLIFAELKTQRGQLTAEQETWLAALAATGAETYIWRPDQWNEIEEVLR